MAHIPLPNHPDAQVEYDRLQVTRDVIDREIAEVEALTGAKAGVCMDVVKELSGEFPILGVCLGHQAICAAFGATVTYAKQLMHGKSSIVTVDTDSVMFRGLDEKAEVARYHSLAADKDTIPECLKVTAKTEDGEVIAVQHRDYKVYGLQFHPESILTPCGRTMISNFLSV